MHCWGIASQPTHRRKDHTPATAMTHASCNSEMGVLPVRTVMDDNEPDDLYNGFALVKLKVFKTWELTRLHYRIQQSVLDLHPLPLLP